MPTYSQGTRCTVQLGRGGFCDVDSAPDMPFPICVRHALALYRRMHEMVAEVQGKHREHPELHDAVVQQVTDTKYAKANTRAHQVYYVRVGELIKVGTTVQLRNRLASYPPGSELLAIEPGGESVETRRHRQFKHLLAHRKEWFHPGPDLMDHIAVLAERSVAKTA